MKKLLCIIIAVIISVCPVISGAKSKSILNTKFISIDENGADGYNGDLILAYNNADITAVAKSLEAIPDLPEIQDYNYDDYDETLSSKAKSYKIGDVATFHTMYGSDEKPNDYGKTIFKLVGIGKHCYMWIPTKYKLGFNIDNEFADNFCKEFDNNYDTIVAKFGTPVFPNNTDKVFILAYDVNYDGVGGVFYSGDYNYDKIAAVHVDTFTFGETREFFDMSSCLVHEFVHLINYCNANWNMPTWLNECLAMQGAELAYPESEVFQRALEWNTPEISEPILSGKSMFDWDSKNVDIAPLYSPCFFFGQYLKTQAGTYNIFRRIIYYYEWLKKDNKTVTNKMKTAEDAIKYGLKNTPLEGKSLIELNKLYRIAMSTAFLGVDCGLYSFRGEEKFKQIDPMISYDMTNVSVGGAITIVNNNNGAFFPPKNAQKNVSYVGISFLDYIVYGDTDANGQIDSSDATKILRHVASLEQIVGAYLVAADANKDGTVDSSDATKILRVVAKLDTL